MKAPKSVITRTYLIYIAAFLAMVLVMFKTVAIVLDNRKEEGEVASASSALDGEDTRLPERFAYIKPKRGEILDCNGNPLVTSVSFYDIYMDPVTVEDDLWEKGLEGLCKGLSKLFPSKTTREYENKLRRARKRGDRYVLIKKRASYQQRKKLRKLPIFKQGRFDGGLIDNQKTIIRKRPYGELADRTLGYVRKTTKDTLKVGIEGAYNKYLKGKEGIIIQQKIANKWRPTGEIVRPPKNGYDVVTSIDIDIQEVANNELKEQLEKKGGRFGCAIVMDVKTGFIKAMVNLQRTEDGTYHEVYNNAIGTRKVPGSTMKLASLLAAMEDGEIKLSDTINASGKYHFFDQTILDANYGRGYGKITIKKAFEYSSNVISKVIYDAFKDNPKQYFDRLDQFGITQKTGINLLGEPIPRYSYPGKSGWWAGSLAWLGIGYEFELTPLQILSFYNAVANDGDYMKPQLVKKIVQNKKVVKTFQPVVLHHHIASQKNIDLMKDAMEGVVEIGTGHRLRTSTYFKLAGKTGTAEIANRNKGYGKPGEKKYIASFIGYFPANDPIYSCIVAVAAPTKDIYGASVSGTVVAAIANKVYANSYQYHEAVNEKPLIASAPQVKDGDRRNTNQVLNRLGVPKQLNPYTPWIQTSISEEDKVKYAKLKVKKGVIPDVRGMGLRDAMYLLEKRGLIVRVSGYGKVVHQSVAPGTRVTKGRVIKLKLE